MSRLTGEIVRRTPLSVLLNPFEYFLAALCIISGLPQLIAPAPNNSLEILLPVWLVRVWGAELVAGGVLTLAGLAFKRPRVERIGMKILAPAATAYAIAIGLVAGWAGVVAASIVLAFGMACLARAAVLLHFRQVIERGTSDE